MCLLLYKNKPFKFKFFYIFEGLNLHNYGTLSKAFFHNLCTVTVEFRLFSLKGTEPSPDNEMSKSSETGNI